MGLPESTFWVNLHPTQPDRMIDAGLGAPYYSHGDCFCDDCNVRVRVAQDKYCGRNGTIEMSRDECIACGLKHKAELMQPQNASVPGKGVKSIWCAGEFQPPVSTWDTSAAIRFEP